MHTNNNEHPKDYNMLEYNFWMRRNACFLSDTWSCIPSTKRNTVHSDSATEFTSGFPSYIPRKRHASRPSQQLQYVLNESHVMHYKNT